MRVTIGMISSQYRNNLNNSLGSLNYYNNRATTLNKFSRVSEDPVGAAQSFRLRREYQDNLDFQGGVRDVENQFLTSESSIMAVNTIVQEALGGDCLKAITGTTGADGRDIIAKKLDAMQDSILSTMNGKFADRYLFGGSDASKPPFTVDKNGKLLYRGADVNTGKLDTGATANHGGSMVSFGTGVGDALNGYKLVIESAGKFDPSATPPVVSSGAVDDTAKTITLKMVEGETNSHQIERQLRLLTANGKSLSGAKVTGDGLAALKLGSSMITDTVSLDDLANEKSYVDLGMGLDVSAKGEVNPQSAFDTAIPGIKFLGYGMDTDGQPNNIYNLIGEISKELRSPTYSMDKVTSLMKPLEKQAGNLMTSVTEIGVKTNFLTSMKSRLSENEVNLSVKIQSVEQVDPAMAIMDFKMQEYAYNAALQMGTKILQPTFLDFMR